MIFSRSGKLSGQVTVPGDKSISHRSVMFGSIAEGVTEIHGFLQGADCLSTISCFSRMGISIENQGDTVLVHGKGLHGLTAPTDILDCGNSGTTTRLISGILSAQNFDVTLTGDESIQKRPMRRIIHPLSEMGARIESVRGNDCAPLHITGSSLHGISYHSPVASAQVKSSILLAGLYAEGETRVTEPYVSRNHSELMLRSFGADVRTEGTTAILTPVRELYGQKLLIPGDISSAAFFIAAALIVPGSEVLIKNVGINPTRDGILRVCRSMNADITLLNQKDGGGEPTADLLVRSSTLKGTVIEGEIIPTLIDELPVIAAMACFAEGTTIIRDAAELKVKESNRIAVMTENLTAMGADVTETEDGMIIRGGKPLHGAVIDSKKDHRIAMTFAVTALAADGKTEILDADCVNISYPGFYGDLERLRR
ncbi:MAG: 3-phosphoshikimate 1-carboxyvinyltransferase [Otoolea sp.]|nr:3-phosphoshikimate 1-carboxyvinyltransferase [Clostridium sp.]MDY5483897.1 3-phosphoshikimate 1-carboxyvinyltransferase [Clostridium sp.]